MLYNEYIQNIINERGQWNIPEGEYFEKHHIIPKCLGGSNDKSNIIYLFAREHFIAHKLLADEYQNDYKIQYAFASMCQNNKGLRKDYISEDDYELGKKALSKASSIKNSGKGNPMHGVHRYGKDNPNYGKKHPGISKGEKNGMYGKHPKDVIKDYNGWKAKLSCGVKNYYANLTPEDKQKRFEHIRGDKNGMYGKYGLSKRSVKVKCIETGEVYCSISDAERQTGICNIKNASKTGHIAGGYHWERL